VSATWAHTRWRLWDNKIQGDSENKNWMTANTKPCPKCGNPVEKNGGCNHVSCRCGQARSVVSLSWLFQASRVDSPSTQAA